MEIDGTKEETKVFKHPCGSTLELFDIYKVEKRSDKTVAFTKQSEAGFILTDQRDLDNAHSEGKILVNQDTGTFAVFTKGQYDKYKNILTEVESV